MGQIDVTGWIERRVLGERIERGSEHGNLVGILDKLDISSVVGLQLGIASSPVPVIKRSGVRVSAIESSLDHEVGIVFITI